MTHFVGAVVVPPSVDTSRIEGEPLKRYLETMLEKFSENREVDVYVKYTREEAIAKSRENIQIYAESLYAKYLKDPVAYEANCTNPRHVEYLKEEFPKKLEWSDEEHYADFSGLYSEDEIGSDGSIYSTANPDGRWDWWTIGGRWRDTYAQRQGEVVGKLLEFFEGIIRDANDPIFQRELAVVEREVEDAFAKLKGGEISHEEFRRVEGELLNCPAYIPWWVPEDVVYLEGNEPIWKNNGDAGWFGTRTEGVPKLEWLEVISEALRELDPESKVIYIDFHV